MSIQFDVSTIIDEFVLRKLRELYAEPQWAQYWRRLERCRRMYRDDDEEDDEDDEEHEPGPYYNFGIKRGLERQCREAVGEPDDPQIPQPPVRPWAEFEGQRLVWFALSDIVVDGRVWAQCYGLRLEPETLNQDVKAIVERIERLLGKVKILFEDELPF